MEIITSSHRLTLCESTGEFEVFPLQERQLHVTEFQNGVKVRDEIETDPDPATKRLLEFANRVPLFAASFAGDGYWNVDLDCGMSRWNGQKSEAEVRKALRRCGFSVTDARRVIAAAKVQQHNWIARVA